MTDSKISYHRDRNGIPEIDLFVPFVVIHDREPSCMAGWIVIALVTVPSRSAHNFRGRRSRVRRSTFACGRQFSRKQ
jgi:hypothetical protein